MTRYPRNVNNSLFDDNWDKNFNRVAKGVGAFGCLVALGYLLFWGSVVGLVVWAFLHFALGVV